MNDVESDRVIFCQYVSIFLLIDGDYLIDVDHRLLHVFSDSTSCLEHLDLDRRAFLVRRNREHYSDGETDGEIESSDRHAGRVGSLSGHSEAPTVSLGVLSRMKS